MIEDWTEFLTVYGLSKKDGDCLIRDYGSPGKPLAEQDGWIVGDDLKRLGTGEPVTVFFAAPVTPEIKRKNVRVLILEVKK